MLFKLGVLRKRKMIYLFFVLIKKKERVDW